MHSDVSRSSCEDTHQDIDNSLMVQETGQEICNHPPSSSLSHYIEKEGDNFAMLEVAA